MLKPYIYFVITIGILSIFQLKFVKDSVIASTICCSILTSFKIQISLSNEHLGLLPFVFQSFITFGVLHVFWTRSLRKQFWCENFFRQFLLDQTQDKNLSKFYMKNAIAEKRQCVTYSRLADAHALLC